MMKTSVVVLSAGIALLPGAALALINPNFTPIHLADQSQTILRLKLKAKAAGDQAEFAVLGAMKGKAPGKVTVDLTQAAKQHAEAARKTLSAASGETVLMFSGTYDGKKLGYLHVGGTWMLLSGGAGGRWLFEVIDQEMPATWAGGTDMLQRCVRYILDSKGAATVPVAGGTAWREMHNVGQIKGTPSGLTAVDLAGDGKLTVHVASPAGDRLLRHVAGKEAFEDLTAKLKLAAKSRSATWGDFNGDGRLDLASFDGKALTIWTQQAGGSFAAAKAGGGVSLPAKCPRLATIGLVGSKAPALVVSAPAGAVLLVPAGGGAFKARKLPLAKPPDAKWGAPQGALVGDFNNDAIPDVIQPFEREGLLFAAKSGGAFSAGKPCGVNCTPGGGIAAVGDFDADGYLDVVAAGAEGVRIFHNLHNGRFAETLGLSGEVAYKAQPFASACGVCDFNNDSRQDLFITYSGGQPLLYFNRGFRSYGEAPKLEMALNDIEGLTDGQETGLFADVNGNGAEDFIVVLKGGKVWCAYNDLGDEGLGLKPRLSGKASFPGPVRVTAWAGKRCLGAFQVRAGAGATLIGLEEEGNYVLKWRFPGGPEQQRKVTAEDRPVEILLDKPAVKPAEVSCLVLPRAARSASLPQQVVLFSRGSLPAAEPGPGRPGAQ